VKSAPVAIVGGGPVGLMLALQLDHYGVGSVLFNTEPEVRPHPKGSTHNARTMEHHRRLGIARQIRALGLPPDRPTDVSYFTRLNGYELARLRMPSEAEKQRTVAESSATHQVPEPILRANQLYVEQFLLEYARSRPNISVRFGWTVEGFEDDETGVTVRAEAPGGRETWRAQYLVGADGGEAPCAARWPCAITGLPSSTRRTMAGAWSRPTCGRRRSIAITWRAIAAGSTGWSTRRCARPSSRCPATRSS
jgi:2-polyprenyl-6-methoxyphenol hydroxylase-like FAD-dependent oxidoreductase